MAQSGYTPISIYYSSTATNVPTAGNLVNGELAINITDGKLFYKDNAGVVQTIAGKGGAGVAGGSNTQVQYNSSGSLAGSANMVFDGSTLTTLNSAYTGTLTGGTGVVNLGSGQFYKDASGNFGLGTTSPRLVTGYRTLTLDNTTGSTLDWNVNGTRTFSIFAYSGNIGLQGPTAADISITTNNAERMRITSGGSVLIGQTTAPSSGTGLTTNGVQYNYSTSGGGLIQTPNGTGLSFYTYTGAMGSETYTERMRIDSSGNVGIGGSPASEWASSTLLQLNTASTYSTFSLASTRTPVDGNRIGSIAWDLPNNTSTYKTRAVIEGLCSGSTANKFGGSIVFSTASDNTQNPTERMRITSAGNVGIGVATPAALLHVYQSASADATAQVEAGVAGYAANFNLVTNNAAGGAYSNVTATAGGVNQWYIGGNGSQQTLAFKTGGGERMRIDSSGNVLINTTSVIDGILNVVGNLGADVCTLKSTNSATATPLICWNSVTSGNNYFVNFCTESSLTSRGTITYNRAGGLTVYGTTSDQRLKENIVDAPSAFEKINSVKIRSFNWKETGNTVDFGVIAQELETVSPECVVQGQNNEDGSMKTAWMVDTSALVPAMIKAIQELKAEIDILKGNK